MAYEHAFPHNMQSVFAAIHIVRACFLIVSYFSHLSHFAALSKINLISNYAPIDSRAFFSFVFFSFCFREFAAAIRHESLDCRVCLSIKPVQVCS